MIPQFIIEIHAGSTKPNFKERTEHEGIIFIAMISEAIAYISNIL